MRNFLLLALLMLLPAQAQALSCDNPELTQSSYSDAVIVFEGTLTKDGLPPPHEDHPASHADGDGHDHGPALDVYTFKIEKLWKGDNIGKVGETIQIARNTFAAGEFKPDVKYLVTAYEDMDGLEAMPCSATMPLADAEKSLKFLNSMNKEKKDDK